MYCRIFSQTEKKKDRTEENRQRIDYKKCKFYYFNWRMCYAGSRKRKRFGYHNPEKCKARAVCIRQDQDCREQSWKHADKYSG